MKKILVLMTLALAFVSCSQKQTTDDENRVIKVKTIRVQSVNNAAELDYSGTVEASQVIPLSFITIGTVNKILVDVGDPVKKGQLLATIDNSEMQNIRDAALARYQQAQDAYDRLKMVHDQGSLPDIKWVEMESNLEQAKSSLDLAENNLDKCNMISPVDGFVGQRNIEPGQSSLNLTKAPIEIVKIETVLVKISVPEKEINKFKTGQEASVSVNALGGKTYQGKVTNVSPIADIMSRTYTVKIAVGNTDHELKPGMVCDVNMHFDNGPAILVIPSTAVSKDNFGNTYVFLVSSDGKTVKKQPVTVGTYNDSGIEVTDGLSEGEIIVSRGIEKLSDNSQISY